MSTKIDRIIKSPNQCGICSAPAKYTYFGVIACNPCKMFFKRNAEIQQPSFRCDRDNQCEITINTRHICPSCRLAKCFQSGMSAEKFRACQPRRPKSVVQSNVLVPMLPRLNLLQSDLSLLSTEQWTLLSCLLNSCQESKLLLMGQQLTDSHDTLQTTTGMYRTLMNDFVTCVYEMTGSYLLLNHDLCKLSPNDRSIMLYNAAHNTSSMIGAFIVHHNRLLNLHKFSSNMETTYGKSIIDIYRWGTKFVLEDRVLVKLAMALFAFSENICSYSPTRIPDYTNPLNIVEVQHKYAEVAWKYLLYKYGDAGAVKEFLNLTSWLMAMAICMYHTRSLTRHVNDVDALVEYTEVALILDADDSVEEMKD